MTPDENQEEAEDGVIVLADGAEIRPSAKLGENGKLVTQYTGTKSREYQTDIIRYSGDLVVYTMVTHAIYLIRAVVYSPASLLVWQRTTPLYHLPVGLRRWEDFPCPKLY